MKTTILLMFSFFFTTGALFGQNEKPNYIDSDIRHKFFPITIPDSFGLKRPYFNPQKKIDEQTLKDLDRFGLYPDSSSFRDKNIRLYSDFVVVEEFSEASKYYSFPFVIKPDTKGKILIIKPDTSENIKHHLIIKDPIRQTITK